MRLILSIAVISFAFLLSVPSFAETKDIKKVEKQITSEAQKKSNLDKAKKQHAKKLSDIKKNLVSQTKKLQKKEKELITLNRRLDEITTKIDSNITALSQNKEHNAQLMLAAHRVATVPPEIMIARPGSPVEIARTRMILKSTLPAMYTQAQGLQETLNELTALQSELKRKKALADVVKKELRTKQHAMEKQLNKRKKLLATTSKDRKKQEKKIAELKKKSKDLKSLITALDNDPSLSDTNKKSTSSLFKNKGFTMPVSGYIQTNYGQKNDSGKSEGITVASTAGAVVVAPYPGTVRFAGPFRSYKLIVIIEHSNGYHSLLAGLSEIYLPVGTKVLGGEPVGKLKDSGSTKTSLYYELRHNGKPTNPNKTINISG